MDYQVALLVFGILLLLVGLVGKVKAKELEIGANSKLVRIIITVIGVILVLISFNPETVKWVLSNINNNPTDTTSSNGPVIDTIGMHNGPTDSLDQPDESLKPKEPELILQMKPLAGEYIIQQMENKRYVDAHETNKGDFALVTRRGQKDATQKWIFTHLGDNVYSIQQKSSKRFIDAYQEGKNEYAVVTRDFQNDDSQKWILTPLGNYTYTIQQMCNNRYLDAYLNKSKDYALFTGDKQDNNTQKWIIKP